LGGADPEYLRVRKDEIKEQNRKRLPADSSGVFDVGSAGVGFIVGVYTSTRNSGGRFILVGLRSHVREVFELTRFSTVIPLPTDITSGLSIL
jgi:anti-anti-sigma factor